jgi:citronellol/citronellal dehydrogenase
MFRDDLFSGKKILITGGATGIGFEMAQQFMQCGASVWIVSRKEEKLIKASGVLADLGEVHYSVCDIRDRDQIAQLVGDIQSRWGELDFLVNNAGGQFPSMAEDISDKGWDAVVSNNLTGTWNMTKAVANGFFIPARQGRIVNVIMSVFRGFPGMAHSAAARGGVEALTKTLAVEWAKYHIQVNAIAPGIIDSTGLLQYPDELKQGIADTIPLKRLGKVEEVGSAALYLCSPLGSFITGETLYIDGGQRLWGDMYKV